jgi:hypothetical protein
MLPSLSIPRGPVPSLTTEGPHVLAAPAGVSPAHLLDAGATHENHTSRPRAMKSRYSCHPSTSRFHQRAEEAQRRPVGK